MGKPYRNQFGKIERRQSTVPGRKPKYRPRYVEPDGHCSPSDPRLSTTIQSHHQLDVLRVATPAIQAGGSLRRTRPPAQARVVTRP